MCLVVLERREWSEQEHVSGLLSGATAKFEGRSSREDLRPWQQNSRPDPGP
jgi:hypothetical protein